MQYLGLNLEELFKIKLKNKPFGDSPWPCLNGGAEHYLKPIVENLEMTYDCKSKKVIGTFTCSCGFIYSRVGPDVDKNDRYKIGRIKSFGMIWEGKLKELVDRRLSLRAIARELRVDAKTVEKYADKLGLELYWKAQIVEKMPDLTVKTFNNNNKPKRDYRNAWGALIEKFPEKSKTELRKMNKGLYMSLYRNDREWLNKNSPIPTKNTAINNRVNWDKRDEEILIDVQNAVEGILKLDGKPQRITISSIGKKIGKLSLFEKQLDKMPKTKVFLEGGVESTKGFQQRRIKWAISELEKEEKEIVEWKVFRKAGL